MSFFFLSSKINVFNFNSKESSIGETPRFLWDSRKELGSQAGESQQQNEFSPHSGLNHILPLITSVPGRKRIWLAKLCPVPLCLPGFGIGSPTKAYGLGKGWLRKMLWEPDKGKKGYWTEQDSWYPLQTPLNSHFLSTASIWSVLTEHLPSWHWLGTGDRNALLELILMRKDRHWTCARGLRAVRGVQRAPGRLYHPGRDGSIPPSLGLHGHLESPLSYCPSRWCHRLFVYLDHWTVSPELRGAQNWHWG